MKEKLIRADSLLEQIKSPYTEYPIMIGIRKAIKEMIDEAPEIDAIPVEWIKKWINNIVNNERYKNDYVELTEEVKRIVYRQDIIIKIPCISDMLEDWKEENGKQ